MTDTERLLLKNVNVGMYSVVGVSALIDNTDRNARKLITLSFIERSKVLSKAVSTSVALGDTVSIRDIHGGIITKNEKFYTVYKPVRMGRDKFFLVTILNKAVGKDYVLTDIEHKYEDIYNFLMCNYKLPLLREWIPELLVELLDTRSVSVLSGWDYAWEQKGKDVESSSLPGAFIHGKNVPVKEVVTFSFKNLTDQLLQECVSSLIKRGTIKVADAPSEKLNLESFDSYIAGYGQSLVTNLEKSIETLAPLDGELKGFAAKNKRLYPQQAACINGIIALKKAGSRYGLMVEGMGCGKTLQGAAVVDAYFNQEWLNSHKGKDLKDLYMSKDQPKYRNVLMAPSHLVAKWKEEILSEIPGTDVIIINDFNQLLEIREKGKERTGREWYLISKDFCKLGSQLSPIPTTVAKMVPKGMVCVDCQDDPEKPSIVYKQPGKAKCERCGGRHFRQIELHEYGERTGLVCPSCGGLLLRPSPDVQTKGSSDKAEKMILTPADFATHTSSNDTCAMCGEHLWGVDCKPIGVSQDKDAAKRKWYKITHFKNQQKKGKKTAFVLKNHERDYLMSVPENLRYDVKKSPIEYGPRRYAPSLFIKKYLKGYFDFTVLDEAHKYEAGGSAQSVAAHALMLSSSFTLGLTGTICNGKADSFFYLLYMLDPRRMRKRGFEYSDVMEFAKQYGCVETVYEATGGVVDGETEYRAMSRGRVVQSPKIKPGISPLLFTDFLLDKAVFLDLSDLSSYLPPLKEEVVLCPMPDDVSEGYHTVVYAIKDQTRQKGGRALLSSMLQFSLSYPDKPYGYNPIMHPAIEDTLICNVPSCDSYRDESLENLLPKEEKLIDIVNKEISQDRNCFVYCAYTGTEEMNVTGRLLTLIEEKCNLKGQVLIMQSASPEATKREAYIRQKASEGIRVFICNMKLVETGLDFCFKYNGANYNYPTIIFYQLTYELAVMWQASRRHYRLNQTQECHTYYMATEGTAQQAAVQIMAEKQVAASAIQGKFSVDGLVSMAKGIDPRVKLAQMLAEGDDGCGRESLENMFDVMNQGNFSDDGRYDGYVPPKTFYEIMEGEEMYSENKTENIVPIITSIQTIVAPKTTKTSTKTTKKEVAKNTKTETKKASVSTGISGQMSMFDLFADFKPIVYNEELVELQPKAKAKKVKAIEGQVSLFDFAA